MNTHDTTPLDWPRWFRFIVVALSTIALSACRSNAPCDPSPVAAPQNYQTMPPQAYAGQYADPYAAGNYGGAGYYGDDGAYADGEYGCSDCVAADGCQPGFTPPGIAGPWPRSEYLCDGGDRLPSVKVGSDWRVHGLDGEDTIVHYDTIGGGTQVEAANKVCMYAPRFGAVRQVTNFDQFANIEQPGRVHLPVEAGAAVELVPPSTTLQQDVPVADVAVKQLTTIRDQDPLAIAIRDIKASEFAKGFLAFEDFQIIRWGQFDNSEKARLAERVDAAVAWTADVAVQVVIDGHEAQVVNGDQKAQATFQVDAPAKGKLRVVKVASACDAKPGETVDFTIRFDNVGESDIGNVTVVDNLITRLEFVPGSNQSNLAADFFTQPNDLGSVVVRWEIKEPIKPGHGGIVRFKCKVR
ncbi:MAG: hypothetical protein WD875_18500 [Pirellulales bacterium]